MWKINKKQSKNGKFFMTKTETTKKPETPLKTSSLSQKIIHLKTKKFKAGRSHAFWALYFVAVTGRPVTCQTCSLTDRFLYSQLPVIKDGLAELLLVWTVSCLNYFSELFLYWRVVLLTCCSNVGFVKHNQGTSTKKGRRIRQPK